ncbi:nucleolar transcription factor 1-like [Pollicipes pollicipes]|uniref:nucleolar transcription factor 1-like n=1 Tax=Pollicipes pollicipes TaxID=41117 RepID=UPI001884F63C|nr:nucleolar transcription factor 1-like [Pollicipes pollicipes]
MSVAFDGHSAEECQQRWGEIQSRLRLHRSLPELLDDALASRWDPNRLRKWEHDKLCLEGGPVKPKTPFIMFMHDKRPKVMKKHPNMTAQELMGYLGRKYSNDPAVKAAYTERYQAAMEEYRQQEAEFRKQHAEIMVDQPPKRPLTPLQCFRKKRPGLSYAEVRVEFAKLSAPEKGRFIRRALRSQEKYDAAVEAYQERYPGWKPPKARRVVSKQQSKMLKIAEGKVFRLTRAYDLFRRDMFPTCEGSAKERLQRCTALWREADSDTRQGYQARADQENAHFRDSMPPHLKKKAAPRKRRRKITAKMAFVEEKMPSDFSTLSEAEWRQLLSRKFNKLSQQDKETLSAPIQGSESAAEEISSPRTPRRSRDNKRI